MWFDIKLHTHSHSTLKHILQMLECNRIGQRGWIGNSALLDHRFGETYKDQTFVYVSTSVLFTLSLSLIHPFDPIDINTITNTNSKWMELYSSILLSVWLFVVVVVLYIYIWQCESIFSLDASYVCKMCTMHIENILRISIEINFSVIIQMCVCVCMYVRCVYYIERRSFHWPNWFSFNWETWNNMLLI